MNSIRVLNENSIRNVVSECTRFPEMRVLIALPQHSDIKSYEEKIEKLLDSSHIKRILISWNTCEIIFHNNSMIQLVRVNDGARGRRANAILYDNTIDDEVVKTILAPLLRKYRDNIWGENSINELLPEYDDESIDMKSEVLDEFLQQFIKFEVAL